MAKHFPSRAATGHRSRHGHQPQAAAAGHGPPTPGRGQQGMGGWAMGRGPRWRSPLMRKAIPWQDGGMQGSANLPFDKTAEVLAHPWDTCFLQIFSLFTILNMPLVIFII